MEQREGQSKLPKRKHKWGKQAESIGWKVTGEGEKERSDGKRENMSLGSVGASVVKHAGSTRLCSNCQRNDDYTLFKQLSFRGVYCWLESCY